MKNISLDNDEKALIEGSIGSFVRARFLDDLVLEVIGSHGELRLDLTVNDLLLQSLKSDGSIGEREA